jgi:murein DD-endopeptidase MepM/ murein hydrolase activator NlpD
LKRLGFFLALLALPVAGHGAPAQPGSALALAALDRRIADFDAEEIASKHELTDIGPRIKQAHDRSLSHGRAYYKLSRAGLLPVGGGFDALVSHAMRVERVRHALSDDLADEKKLREQAADVSRNLERVAKDRESLASQRTAMDSARLAMEDEARRHNAFEKAFESSNGGSDYVATGGPEVQSSGFAAMRGKLLFPVAGRGDVRAAKREGADGPGVEILAPARSQVRAVYAGRVGFADRYGAYGRIVIVDHGDHYYTVSGNLGSIDVRVGDEVSAGERIGTVGDDGAGPMLYFELRHGSQTIAPASWLGL